MVGDRRKVSKIIIQVTQLLKKPLSMLLINVKAMTVIQRLFMLRSLAIIIQYATVLIVYFVMSLQISLLPLLAVITIEAAFHLLSIYIFKKRNAGNIAIVFQLIADIIFLSVLLSLSGGATNAFVSLLLLPIIIAAVSLPYRYLSIISLSAISAYSLLLMNMPMHSMHQMEMNNHFIGMWANFLLSVVVVTIVVGTMARIIANREQSIAEQREAQFRSEQLLALGMSSAQVTHQLATPLANIQLLFDELLEDHPESEAVKAMQHPLEQCRDQLNSFRHLASSIRTQEKEPLKAMLLLNQLKENIQLNFPQQQVEYQLENINSVHILSDAMLIPAMLNLIQNAIKANKEANENRLILKAYTNGKYLHLSVRDFGIGIQSTLNENQKSMLGERLVESSDGLGMALLLSNTTFNRLKGSLKIENHVEQGSVAHVKLPIINNHNSEINA